MRITEKLPQCFCYNRHPLFHPLTHDYIPQYSAQWNATCGQAHYRVQRNELLVPGYYYPINTTFIVFHIIFVFFTIAWFKYEQNESVFLQKRSLLAISVSALGGILILIFGPIRNINSAQFPCDVQVIFLAISVPLVLTPVGLRLYAFRGHLEWNRHLAKTSVHKLNSAVGNELSPDWKDERKSPHGSMVSVPLASLADTSMNMSDQNSIISSGLMEKLTSKLWFRDGIWSSLAIGNAAILFYFLCVSLPILLVKPYYLNGCTGCLWYPDEQGAVTLSSMIVAAMIIYFSYDIRLEKDPLEIRSEILAFLPVPMFIGTIGAAGMFFDALLNEGRIGDAGIIQFEWFLEFAVIWIHAGQCPLQIWKARRLKHVEHLPSKDEFALLLSNPSFLDLFETHCITEFCVENLKFVLAVNEYMSKYDFISIKERSRIAKGIYRAFIMRGGVMEINIKHPVRKALETIFDVGGDVSEHLDKNIFEPAASEIWGLMRTDTLMRCTATKEYKDWAARSTVVNPGAGMSILV